MSASRKWLSTILILVAGIGDEGNSRWKRKLPATIKYTRAYGHVAVPPSGRLGDGMKMRRKIAAIEVG